MAKLPRTVEYFFKGGLFFIIVFLLLFIKHYSKNSVSKETFNQRSLLGDYSTNLSSNLSTNSTEYSCFESNLRQLPQYATDFCATNKSCKPFTCYDILFNTSTSHWVEIAPKISSNSYIQSDESYHNLSCSNFRSSRNFSMKPVNKESAKFPIAFNILLHKSANQFEVLLQSLYRPQNAYCIHLDGKADANLQKAIVKIAGCFPNVYMASSQEKVIYAGYTRLQADITCMRDHLNRGTPFKYLLNTASSAFPLRTIEEMVSILKIYNGTNDIEGIYKSGSLKNRIGHKWRENKKKFSLEEFRKESLKKPPHDIHIVKGSAYGIFSRDFVHYIINNRKAQDLLEWSKNTYSPDEFFWSTLHHSYSNPHLKAPGSFSGHPRQKEWLAVYANWGEKKCFGKYVRGICVFGVGDLSSLIQRKEFFLNKFHPDYQPLALSCLSLWLETKKVCNVPFDTEYYKNLKFLKRAL